MAKILKFSITMKACIKHKMNWICTLSGIPRRKDKQTDGHTDRQSNGQLNNE